MQENATLTREFGWLPINCAWRTASVEITPLNSFQQALGQVRTSGQIADGWFLPPILGPTVGTSGPQVSAPTFRLPTTHLLRANPPYDTCQCIEFLIQVVGLANGYRLLPSNWQHFYKTPVVTGKATDLVCDAREVERVLVAAERFWLTHSRDDIRRAMFGAVHWRLFSPSYEHEFERFGAEYTVLDTCYWIHCQVNGLGRNVVSHALRAEFLCQAYGLPTPVWAVAHQGANRKSSSIADLRNEFVHEGRYGGQPLGFAHPNFVPSIDLQLANLNTRLILSLLGVSCAYVRSPVGTRSMIGLM